MSLNNNQIDKLGKRLQCDTQDINRQKDLELLEEFRQTYRNVADRIYQLINETLNDHQDKLTVVERKRKTKNSIIEKLCRLQNSKLSRMQDIAGCRIVVNGGSLLAKEINNKLIDAFKQKDIKLKSDNRNKYGYKAIHLIAKCDQKFYEIQLRTYAQDIFGQTL